MIETFIILLMAIGMIIMLVIGFAIAGVIGIFYVFGGLIGIALVWVIISVIWYWIKRLYYWGTGKTPPDDIGEILGHKQIEVFIRALERVAEKARENYEKSEYGDMQ